MKVLAGLMSLGLSGCSFVAFARPVVVPPPGGGHPLTTVGSTVRCRSSAWPMAVDVLGAGTAVVSAALTVGTLEFLQAMSHEERDEYASTMAAMVFLVPAGIFIGSAIYGGVRSQRCRDARAASARAKLRGEPLHLQGVDYEVPMGPTAPPGAAAPQRNPPPGPPQSVAQPPAPSALPR